MIKYNDLRVKPNLSREGDGNQRVLKNQERQAAEDKTLGMPGFFILGGVKRICNQRKI